MPEVVAAYEKFKGQGFEVIGISIDDAGKAEKIRDFRRRLGMKWPEIYDGGGSKGPLASRNDVTGIPAAFLLDRGGRARYTDLSGPELQQRIAELLAESVR